MPQTKRTSNTNFLITIQVATIVAVIFLLIKPLVNPDKMAYVASGKILDEYKGAKDAKKAYDAKTKVWQQNIETLTGEVRSDIQKYEKAIATSGKSEQNMARELIKSKQKELSDYQRGIQANATEEDQKLTQTVVSQINAFLTNYGKKHHYKLILIANQASAIAYASEGMDITDDVIKELNQSYVSTSK